MVPDGPEIRKVNQILTCERTPGAPPPIPGMRPRIPGMRLTTVGHRIHVWCASLRHPPEDDASLRHTLSPDERARCTRLRASRDRRRYSLGRGILRLVLSRYTSIPPHELAFAYGSRGKPVLADRGNSVNGSHLHFNVSHSGDLLLIAVSRRAPVGVDVERVRPIPHMDSIARRWLPAHEWRAIRGAPAKRGIEMFFAGWAAAEARAKATGEGLWSARRNLEDIPCSIFQPEPGYIGAVATDLR